MLRAVLFACACSVAIVSAVAEDAAAGISVWGPGVPPQIGFACCDGSIEQMQALLVDREVIASLRDLHAEVAIPTLDFSPERAEVVRHLNQAGIPVVAWVELPKEEGFYLNTDNAPEAAARVPRWKNGRMKTVYGGQRSVSTSSRILLNLYQARATRGD